MQTVLITGSSSGIGRATAERFAARGWRVFASMRRPEAGAELRDLAAGKGWRLSTPALDVTRDDSVAAAVGALLAETSGRLDVLVNNAGYYAWGPLEETTPDELRAQLETNVVGVLRVTRAVLPAMRARRAGAVVTLGSVSGLVALPVVGPYHASKWALEGMIEAWRLRARAVRGADGAGRARALRQPACTRMSSWPPATARTAPTPALVDAYRRQSASLPRAGSGAGRRRHRAGRHGPQPPPALARRADLAVGAAAALRPRSALRMDHAAGLPAARSSGRRSRPHGRVLAAIIDCRAVR